MTHLPTFQWEAAPSPTKLGASDGPVLGALGRQ